jgi:hypothetical protein
MATYLITHEVDDVEHWWNSPKRAEVFGSLGIAVRAFRDPAGSNKVGLLAEIPDVEAFAAFIRPTRRRRPFGTTACASRRC